MSWNPLLDPQIPIGDQVDLIDRVIVPRVSDLSGLQVRRALPVAGRKMVGPFIFFDEMMPTELLTGQSVDVAPHPHIGLATVTYLFQGRLHHRDSLGTDQWVEPGAVNLMTAGHGITHSERTDTPQRPLALSGIQTWLALPKADEDRAPAFQHAEKAALPLLEAEGKKLRLILGSGYGARAPLQTFSDTIYADALLDPGAALPLPDEHEERAVYVLSGEIEVAGDVWPAGRMLVFRSGDAISLRAGAQGARLMILGGAAMDGRRYVWWNFVASSKDRIDAAKEAWRAGDWAHGRFRLPPGDDQSFVPAPEV